LLLIGCSVSIGGVIERSGMMEMFPHSFDSAWSAMLLLVFILVILGMIMDAFGAVILVSATIATIAYQSGIHPVHFWMVTLVAFELGYLSPPVALNHLLTRQVVGEAEVELALQEGDTFYQRHERIIMPLIVMGIALVIVAFVPLAIGY
jgi:TRAP-type C4-dicarboxylate transport system permease large subunit